jgi:acyl carrier protein
MRKKIIQIFTKVFKDQCPGMKIPRITNKLVLLETGLDSFGFAILIVELEKKIGIDPFTDSDIAFYPNTLGEFIEFYEKHKP